jgi:acyl-CoA reductase-like NAD-dependent aldehyde dehydrogenase
MFINGEAVDSDEHYEIRSPATEELVCTIAKGGVEHADAAVAAARAAFESGIWSQKAPEERAAVLHAIAERLGEELEEITELEISANGATIRQALGFHTGLASPGTRSSSSPTRRRRSRSCAWCRSRTSAGCPPASSAS